MTRMMEMELMLEILQQCYFAEVRELEKMLVVEVEYLFAAGFGF